MVVTFLITRVGGRGWGGAHKVAMILANRLAQDHQVFLFSFEKSTYAIRLSKKVTHICVENYVAYRSTRIFRVVQKVAFIRRCMKKLRVDTLIGFTSNMSLYAVLGSLHSKTKSVATERTDPGSEPKGRIARIVRNVVFRLADGVVFQTIDGQRYFPRKIQEKSTVIVNPVSADLPPVCRKGESRKEIVTFCRLEPQKNIRMLIDAFCILQRAHPEYVLKIFGDGSQKEELEEYIRGIGCRNQIFLLPSQKNILESLVHSAAFVSSSNYEGISNAMLEAMSVGLPTICTDCPAGGARMMIESGQNGLLVPVGDTASLAAAIIKVVEDDALSDRLRKNAVKVRETCSLDTIAAQWGAYLDRVPPSQSSKN